MVILVYDLIEENMGLRNKYYSVRNNGKSRENIQIEPCGIVESWAKDTCL